MYDDFYRFLEEMEALKKENDSLREFRDKKAEYDHELAKMRLERDAAIANAKRDSERMRADEVVRFSHFTGYSAETVYTERPKCSKCNDNRRIRYISPMGRVCYEDCECSKKDVHYEPKEEKLTKLFFHYKGEISTICVRDRKDREYGFNLYNLPVDIYEQMEKKRFDRISRYITVFSEESNCKAYCDFLNERAREKQ